MARAELNPTGADFGAQPPQEPEPSPAPDLVAQRYGDPLATSSYMMDGVPMPSLMASMFAFSLAARGSLPGALGGTGNVKIVDTTWVSRWVDSFDPNDSYTFEYTDEQGVSHTATATGSVMSSDEGYFVNGTAADTILYATCVNPYPMLRTELNYLRGEVGRLVARKSCAELISKVFATLQKDNRQRLPVETDMMRLFDIVSSQPRGGITYRPGSKATSEGSWALGTATAVIGGGTTHEHKALQTIHELIHRAGPDGFGYSDREVALAVQQILRDEGNNFAADVLEKIDPNNEGSQSDWWDGHLSVACDETMAAK